MENSIHKNTNESLLLTKQTFNRLLKSVISHFKKSHDFPSKYKDSQLYGFGNYDTTKPNLKNDLELILRGYVNGKYLYNKQREVASGKPIVKISRDYRELYFNYLGYTGIYDFLDKEMKNVDEREKQIQLIENISRNEDFHYVCYYYGEDKKMTKGQLIIHNNWKTFELIFVYFNPRNEHVFYELFGSIKQESNFLHFDCKHFVHRKKMEGSKMIFYVGLNSFNDRPILIGAYSSNDKYDHSIAGKLMLVQMNSKQEMEEESKSLHFDPIICQELVQSRYVIPSRIPTQLSKISSKSPYASIFGKIPSNYKAKFIMTDNEIDLRFSIKKYHYNIVSDMEDIVLENDRIQIVSKGQILELHFEITGIFLLQNISMYIKNYELFSKNRATTGHFSGIDINNNPVSGNVQIETLN